MALIAMSAYDTVANEKTQYTARTLESLAQTVDFSKHRLIVVDNDSCRETKDVFAQKQQLMGFTLLSLPRNIGIARSTNKAWELKQPGEVCIKIDNDIVIHENGWVDKIERVFWQLPRAGVVGLKRKDLEQSPGNANLSFVTELSFLRKERMEPWLVLEKSKDIIGSCVAHNPLLLDKVGYYYQFGEVYGYEDPLMCQRSLLAGFTNYFLPSIEIDHIDPGGTEYCKEKEAIALRALPKYKALVNEYSSGRRPLYHGPQDL